MSDVEGLALTARIVVGALLVVLPASPVLISGDWTWWEAWVFAALSGFGFVVSRLLAVRRNPDIVAERARSMDRSNTKKWDLVLAPVVAFGMLAVWIVAGIDHRRLDAASLFPAAVRWGALAVVLAAYVFASWALVENRFFSGVVRIQHERGHHVVTSGPYRFVRHPGYAGGLCVYLAAPVVLASVWSSVPALLSSVALLVRTALEDRVLHAELPGYSDYARQTRFRLVPGVW